MPHPNDLGHGRPALHDPTTRPGPAVPPGQTEPSRAFIASSTAWIRLRAICTLFRYQLIANATYLPKGYLVAAATYLRCAAVRQASVAASPPVPLTQH